MYEGYSSAKLHVLDAPSKCSRCLLYDVAAVRGGQVQSPDPKPRRKSAGSRFQKMGLPVTTTSNYPSIRDIDYRPPESQSNSDSHDQPENPTQQICGGQTCQTSAQKPRGIREQKQKEYKEARVTFDKTISGHYRNGTMGYRKVGVLLITWEEDDMHCKDTEVEKLRAIFDWQFRFETDLYEIPSERSQSGLMFKVAKFMHEYDYPDCLAILYYAGHANIGEETQKLKLYARACPCSEGDPSTFFDDIRAIVQATVCDQLMILDCCYAAKAFTREHLGKRRFELLASAAYDQKCNAPKFSDSFTRNLNEALPRILQAYPAGFSTAHLFREIYHDLPKVKPQIFDQSQHSPGKIWLRPQINALPTEEDKNNTYVDITLRLTDSPNGVVIHELASHLQYLPHISEVRIKDFYAPKDRIADFVLLVLQVQKLRTSLKRLLARRRIQKRLDFQSRGEKFGVVPRTMPTLEDLFHSKDIEQQLYDWNNANAFGEMKWDDKGTKTEQPKRRRSCSWPLGSALLHQ